MSSTDLNEIRIDKATHASGVRDSAVATTTGEVSTENNTPQGQNMSEIPLAEVEGWYPSWLRQVIAEAKGPQPTKTERVKIPLVSSTKTVRGGRGCYVPKVVSIGPYHYLDRTEELGDVDKLKAPMTRQFVKACGKNMSKEKYAEVQGVVKEARSFYDKSKIMKDFTDEEFVEMMFIDGCFILQFIHCIVKHENENLDMTDEQVASVKRDLLLLENQLPYPVLKSLMNVRYNRTEEGSEIVNHFLSLQISGPGPRVPIWLWVVFPILLILFLIILAVERFVSMIDPLICKLYSEQQSEDEETSGEDDAPAHLLELLYSKFMKSENGKGIYSKLIHGKTRRAPQVTSGHYLYYSAKNLKRVGIHFQPSWSCALIDLEFKSSIFFGTLKIPPVAVNESTKSLLLNLVAHEESISSHKKWVASYICFMDSLINEADDVEVLRSSGILVNYRGADKEVADLFNDMGKYLKPDASTYNDVKRKINKQCESRIGKWVAEWQQKYFGSPWTIIAVLAAAFGLALTATQTYYATYPSCK